MREKIMNILSLVFVSPEENKFLPRDEFCSDVPMKEGGASSAEGIPAGCPSFHFLYNELNRCLEK